MDFLYLRTFGLWIHGSRTSRTHFVTLRHRLFENLTQLCFITPPRTIDFSALRTPLIEVKTPNESSHSHLFDYPLFGQFGGLLSVVGSRFGVRVTLLGYSSEWKKVVSSALKAPLTLGRGWFWRQHSTDSTSFSALLPGTLIAGAQTDFWQSNYSCFWPEFRILLLVCILDWVLCLKDFFDIWNQLAILNTLPICHLIWTTFLQNLIFHIHIWNCLLNCFACDIHAGERLFEWNTRWIWLFLHMKNALFTQFLTKNMIFHVIFGVFVLLLLLLLFIGLYFMEESLCVWKWDLLVEA